MRVDLFARFQLYLVSACIAASPQLETQRALASSDWLTQMNAGIAAYKQRDYSFAERLFREGLAAARNEAGTEWKLSVTYNNLGEIYYTTGQLSEAERMYRHAIVEIKRSANADPQNIL